jgi:hypothetical protein
MMIKFTFGVEVVMTMLPFSIFFQFFGFNSPTSIIIIIMMMVVLGGVTTGFYFLQKESVLSAAIY